MTRLRKARALVLLLMLCALVLAALATSGRYATLRTAGPLFPLAWLALGAASVGAIVSGFLLWRMLRPEAGAPEPPAPATMAAQATVTAEPEPTLAEQRDEVES